MTGNPVVVRWCNDESTDTFQRRRPRQDGGRLGQDGHRAHRHRPGNVYMQPETLRLIEEGQIKKGDVLAVAQVAGIMGAKKTSDVIPMCHPLSLNGVDISFEQASIPIRKAGCVRSKSPRPSKSPAKPGLKWKRSRRSPSRRSPFTTCARRWTRECSSTRSV